MSKHFLTSPRLFTKGRALLTIEPLLWLYERTGEPQLLEMAEKSFTTIEDASEGGEYGNEKVVKAKAAKKAKKPELGLLAQLMSDRAPKGHGVTWCENSKIPVMLYMYTGKKEYLEASIKGFRKLIKHNLLVDGVPNAHEHLKSKVVNGAHETCDAIDLSWSLGYLLQATGDTQWADMIEKAIYNAGLGSISKDFKTHQYYSAPNQAVAAEDTSRFNDKSRWGLIAQPRFAYKPGHDTECCTGNIQRIMPTLVGRMWMKTTDHGIAAALYAPGSVTQVLGKEQQKVTIKSATNYPFAETISFTVQTKQAASFPFMLRIPGWCTEASLSINDEVVTETLAAGSFHRIERTFKNGDTIKLQLPMPVKITRWGIKDSGLALERGPLVYSMPVKTRELKFTDKGIEGIWDFPCRFLYPNGTWSYALSVNEDNLAQNVEVVQSDIKGAYPWDKSPIGLRVSAKKVNNWKLDGNKHTPAWPEVLDLDEKSETITLYPLGSTLLRMTVFPEAK